MRIGSLSDVRRAFSRRPPLVSSGLVLGPELLANSEFNDSSAWIVTNSDATHVVTFSSGAMRYQSDTTSPTLTVSQSVMTAGKTYQVTCVCSARVSGSLKCDAFSGATRIVADAVGTKVFQGVALNASFNFTRNSAGVDISLDSVSVREVLSQ